LSVAQVLGELRRRSIPMPKVPDSQGPTRRPAQTGWGIVTETRSLPRRETAVKMDRPIDCSCDLGSLRPLLSIVQV